MVAFATLLGGLRHAVGSSRHRLIEGGCYHAVDLIEGGWSPSRFHRFGGPNIAFATLLGGLRHAVGSLRRTEGGGGGI